MSVQNEITTKKMANKSFGNVRELKYFGKAVKNKNYIDEKIKRRLNSANVAYCVGSSRHTLAIQRASRQLEEIQLHTNVNSKCFRVTYKNKGEGDTLIDTYRRRPVRSLLDTFYQLLRLFCVC